MAENKQSRRTLFLIDGHAQIFRAYHAIRSLSSPVTKEPTNATFGFVGMLLKLWKDQKPDYVVMTLDVGGDKGTFRSEMYPEYKANRDAPPEDLHPQVERIVQICQLMGIPVLGVPGYEADDLIATVCRQLADHDGLDIRIVSRDKDLQQLISDRVTLYDIPTDTKIDRQTLEEEKGIRPDQVADMLALMGDNVDNIPGVPGIGPKTAAKLISKYGTLDNLLAHTDELTPKQRENVEATREQLALSRCLVELHTEAPVELDLESAVAKPLPSEVLRPLFKQLGFNRYLSELGEAEVSAASAGLPKHQPKAKGAPAGLFDALEAENEAAVELPPAPSSVDDTHYLTITTEAELDELIRNLRAHAEEGGVVSVDTETTGIDPMRASLCGIAFAWKQGHGAYVPVRSCQPEAHLAPDLVLERLRPLLEDARIPKVGQNLKYDLNVFRRAGIMLRGMTFDTMVASYLIDAARSSHKLDNLALAHLNHEMIPIEQLIGSGRRQRSMSDLPHEEVANYAIEDADVTLRLRQVFNPRLKEMGLRELFDEIEMPLVEVLADLEYNGILVEPEELDRQSEVIGQRIDELRQQILDIAGSDFNPDSPRQLAEVLFDKLGCTVIKRGKTGPSTDVEVLQRIAEEQQPPGATLAGLVLEYRQLTKLRGTYLVSLKEAIHPETHRIHASFNQTVTATGRLSSSDPNLQNIPIRTEIGRQIRRAFVAPPGHVLLSADYSQIELRVLAHLAQDPGLVDAFEKDLDIHRAVAAEVFGVGLDQVISEQRAAAKMVNFGIVYGITPFGLARRLANIDPSTTGAKIEDAKRIIEDYNQRYPRIAHFLESCIATAQTHGYVETILHRRRPIPQVGSRNPNIRAFGQRAAINTVVQGSAADLIKVAMVHIHRRIERESLPIRMLLQIHDELVFEIPTDQVDPGAAMIREEMTRAMDLTVPLKVDLAWGENWMESK